MVGSCHQVGHCIVCVLTSASASIRFGGVGFVDARNPRELRVLGALHPFFPSLADTKAYCLAISSEGLLHLFVAETSTMHVFRIIMPEQYWPDTSVTIDGQAPSGCYLAPKHAVVHDLDVVVYDKDAPCESGQVYIHNAGGAVAAVRR